MAGRPASATGAKNCRACPSFLHGQNQTRTIGTNLNGPVCGLKMLPLVKPNQPADTQERVFKHVARNCDKFGVDVRLDPLRPDSTPALSVGIDPSPATGADDQSRANCQSCRNFIPPTEVQRRTGWTGGICRATGNLMPDPRLSYYASKCGTYVFNSADSRTITPYWDTFTFFPQFDWMFGKVDIAKLYRDAMAHIIEPKDEVTDQEVTPGQRRNGIVAWKRLSDPDGVGEDIFYPIYNPEHVRDDDTAWLTATERALVPRTDDDEHPAMYADHGQILYTMFVLWRYLDETPALWGQGGVGKTELMRHLAWRMQLPFHRIPISPTSEVDDLIGKILFEGGQTVPHYGQLTSAWGRPGVILLDEPNTGPPEVVQILRPLTDNSRLLVASSLKDERLTRHNHCYFGLAMNPAWDPRNISTQTLGDADGSRLMHVYFDYPPRELEMEIIQQRVRLDNWELPAAQMNALMEVTSKLREASASGALHTTWGVRHNIKTARALRYFAPVKAFRRAVADSLEPSQLDFVLTSVKSHFGD
jgi:MoxR-like ATPase